jgi:hypothetical protein
MVNNYAISRLELAATWTDGENLSCRFMASNHSRLVSLGSFAKVFVVDTADIRTADRRGLDAENNLAVSRRRYFELSEFGSAISGEYGTLHAIGRKSFHS